MFAVALACLDAVLFGVAPVRTVLPVVVITLAVYLVAVTCMALTRRPRSWTREDRRRFVAWGGKP